MLVHAVTVVLILTFKESMTNGQEDKTSGMFPNIIFIMADDLGYGEVQYNGGLAETPNLNDMASGPHSFKFSRFYSASPICSPTRGSVLTGRHPNRYCLRNNTPKKSCKFDDFNCPAKAPLPTSEVTVAEILKDTGYHTAAFGKWHLGDFAPIQTGQKLQPASHPGLHGFDFWKMTKRTASVTANPNCACINTSSDLCLIPADNVPCKNYYTGNQSNTVIPHNEPIIGDDSHFVANEFAKFLETVTNTNQSFFAYIAFSAVHTKWAAVSPYREMYLKRGMSESEVNFYGTLTAMDDAIGQIRDLLKHYNTSNNTMVWFTSDNGIPAVLSSRNKAGLKGKKGTLHEGGIRVPGIIEWPAVIERNHIISSFPVVTSDFLPTVCDILGISLPENRTIDGISILPLLQGKVEIRNETICWNRNGSRQKRSAITNNQYKLYVEYKVDDDSMSEASLYNILTDPGEKTDLSSELPNVHQELLRELRTWEQSVSQEEVGCKGKK